MALTNILYPVTEPIGNFYAKIKAAIAVLITAAGGTTGQVLTKIDGTDYNYSWQTPATSPITWTTINIGAWSLDNTTAKNVPHGVADISKIVAWSIILVDDTGLKRYDFLGTYGTVSSAPVGRSGYIGEINATNFVLVRVALGAGGQFDTASFNDGVMNRGYLTIGTIA